MNFTFAENIIKIILITEQQAKRRLKPVLVAEPHMTDESVYRNLSDIRSKRPFRESETYETPGRMLTDRPEGRL